MTQNKNRLDGRKLMFMRFLWAAVAITYSTLYLLALPQSVREAFADPALWSEIVAETIYLGLGLVVFWLRSDDLVACIFSVLLMPFLLTNSFVTVFGSSPITERLDLVFAAVTSTLMIWMFYLFPDGRFVPRWTRWAAVAAAGIQFWRIFFEDAYMQFGFPMIGIFMITGAVAQIYRYRRVADAIQRQQIKWIVFSLAITLLPLGIFVILFAGRDDFFAVNSIVTRIGGFIWGALVVLFPLSVLISIFRYRLWDIDIIIRKTLVYTVLSGLLALVYFGLVVLLQSVFNSVSGQQSAVAIVITTLVIAALFAPLRRRIQDVIDRRFYRKKYNAQQVLAQFAQTCRDETDMDRLTAELIRVIQETMQPETTSIWLKPTEVKTIQDIEKNVTMARMATAGEREKT